MYRYIEVIKTVYVEPIVLRDGAITENFKIEVYKNYDGSYSSKIFSLGHFDLTVTPSSYSFHVEEPVIASECIYHVDDMVLPVAQEKKFSNVDDCLNFALQRLEDIHTGRKSVKEANEY